MNGFLTAIFAVVVVSAPVAFALSCYQCFDGAPPELGFPSCSNAKELKCGALMNGCLKVEGTAEQGSEKIEVVYKDCVAGPDEDLCQKVDQTVPGTTVEMKATVCFCTSDLCNSGSSLKPAVLLPVFAILKMFLL